MLELVFRIIKETSNIEGFKFFQKKFIYTAYADDTTIFFKNTEFAINLLDIFKHFFTIFRSQTKQIKMSNSRYKCSERGKDEDTIKVLGIHYSCNKQLENDENFEKYIANENVLKLWRKRNLSLEGKITVFKSLALTKITHLALVKTILPSMIDQLNKTQENFIWNGLNPKIKTSTFNNNYENDRLKNVNIAAKISSLQSSWIKRLFDENFHDWKILPLHIIHKSLGKKFVHHSNLKVKKKLTKSFPKYYWKIISIWGSKLSSQTLEPSAILAHFLWFNSQIQIGKTVSSFLLFRDGISVLLDICSKQAVQ